MNAVVCFDKSVRVLQEADKATGEATQKKRRLVFGRRQFRTCTGADVASRCVMLNFWPRIGYSINGPS